MNRTIQWIVGAVLLSAACSWGQAVPYDKGRIIFTIDGNNHDPDDYGATPAALAMIAAKGLQDKTTLLIHSDHYWASDKQATRAEIQASVAGSVELFGFTGTRVIDAVGNVNQAENAMRDEILASTADDPLYIILAGMTEIMGAALNKAQAIDASSLAHVRVISHSGQNEKHSVKDEIGIWNWPTLKSHFAADGVVFDHIDEQNKKTSKTEGFGTHAASSSGDSYWPSWYFLRDYNAHSESINRAIQFIYEQMEISGKSDISDAGMTYYLFTADAQGGPSDLKLILDNGFTSSPPTEGSIYYIENVYSGNRIRPVNTVEGAQIIQVPETWGGRWTQWEQVPASGEWFYLKNKKSGAYLLMPDSTTGTVVEGSYVTGPEAEWNIMDAAYGVILVNRLYGQPIRCNKDLEVSSSPDGNIQVRVAPDTAAGTKVQWVMLAK
ncbi:RICIN domain-containing protein [Pontiella agarivorans]|uniref:DUF1593 domain-containing protein n=1 Tax=Pontiella agarivorans TaxID=3038953 RepID=A0ABU5MY95_9BACT|nr:hypothetical protein [Pontiella agarivorans]MDZ8119144.1 hypothetical protein [Pontiella agarivorans]